MRAHTLSDVEAMFQAVADDPKDRLVKLALADMLEERGAVFMARLLRREANGPVPLCEGPEGGEA